MFVPSAIVSVVKPSDEVAIVPTEPLVPKSNPEIEPSERVCAESAVADVVASVVVPSTFTLPKNPPPEMARAFADNCVTLVVANVDVPVTVNWLRPSKFVVVAPKVRLVLPIPTDELINAEFGTFNNVFKDASIVLLVNTCVPVSVANVFEAL